MKTSAPYTTAALSEEHLPQNLTMANSKEPLVALRLKIWWNEDQLIIKVNPTPLKFEQN